MKKKFILLTALCCIIMQANAQQILLEEDVNADTLLPSSGANYTNFWHAFIGYGLVLGETEGDGADIMTGYSADFVFGVRYKRKISNFYSVGFDFAYSATSFRLKQDSAKILPNNTINDKEKLTFNNIKGVIYNRFNFGKRGNALGKYIDIGGYGELAFSVKHFTVNKYSVANSAGASKTEVTNSGLLFTELFNYGGQVKLGYNKVSIFGKYRLSDLFKSSYIFPELPRLVIGIEFAFAG